MQGNTQDRVDLILQDFLFARIRELVSGLPKEDRIVFILALGMGAEKSYRNITEQQCNQDE